MGYLVNPRPTWARKKGSGLEKGKGKLLVFVRRKDLPGVPGTLTWNWPPRKALHEGNVESCLTLELLKRCAAPPSVQVAYCM